MRVRVIISALKGHYCVDWPVLQAKHNVHPPTNLTKLVDDIITLWVTPLKTEGRPAQGARETVKGRWKWCKSLETTVKVTVSKEVQHLYSGSSF